MIILLILIVLMILCVDLARRYLRLRRQLAQPRVARLVDINGGELIQFDKATANAVEMLLAQAELIGNQPPFKAPENLLVFKCRQGVFVLSNP